MESLSRAQWVLSHLSDRDSLRFSTKFCNIAAQYGSGDILELARQHGLPWDEGTLVVAARYGHVPAVDYLYSQGCPYIPRVATQAAVYGQLAVLKWAHEHNLQAHGLCEAAASNGHLHILKWSRQYHHEWGVLTSRGAAHQGHFEVLQWLEANGCPIHDKVCETVAKHGNIAIIQYFLYKGYEWTPNAFCETALHGQLELAKWVEINVASFRGNPHVCALAAENSHLNMLKWLRDQQCPWDSDTTRMAAYNGNLDLLDWALSSECPWTETCFAYATRKGDLKVLKGLRTRGLQWGAACCLAAVEYNHLHVLQWLVENDCPCDWNVCWRAAHTRDMIAWVEERMP